MPAAEYPYAYVKSIQTHTYMVECPYCADYHTHGIQGGYGYHMAHCSNVDRDMYYVIYNECKECNEPCKTNYCMPCQVKQELRRAK